ncbi:zinc-ribbon domain-containing protein [Dehalogenimonas formicexedens]|uniref:Zinc-ribbon domain-containing protein n=1 Tax=Dehalogenimonas formicexedens TaxID=1839801 RepID=A0A1P8F961_9CHLR|nr:DUF4328 domain-containing protein [Dehalogenimonas formicexedens]APV45009.1 zinc-ribbon domain-containing protein [Dehalogenimonas formicexedens]
MYCVNCGSQVVSNDSFCTNCGNPSSVSRGVPTVYKPLPKYSSVHGLSLSLAIVFAVLLVVAAVSIYSDILQVQLIDRVANGGIITEAEATTNDARVASIGGIYFLVNIVVIVLFLVWIHTAHRNLGPLGSAGLEYTPGWAVGGFFVPFLNLVRPYQVTKEIWKASDPDFLSTTGDNWKKVRVSSILGWWWALFLITGFFGNMVLRSSFNLDTLENIQSYTYVTLASDIILVPAIILAVVLVLDIDNRQMKRYKVKFFARNQEP